MEDWAKAAVAGEEKSCCEGSEEAAVHVGLLEIFMHATICLLAEPAGAAT